MKEEKPEITGKVSLEQARSPEAFHAAREEYKRVGLRIARLRKGHQPKITQHKLAELAGFSFDYISRIERGEARPSMEALCEIALTLGVQVQEFFVEPGDTGVWNLRPDALSVELTSPEGQKLVRRFRLVQEE